ncbi:MAG: purine/pyrimidine permease [Clostridiaceae bacterium]|nr:purine/pyrimidine permease [Clostridiaceae bacterium]
MKLFSHLKSDESVWEKNPQISKPELGIDEKPNTWWETLLYAWQHTLVDTSPFVLPLVVGTAIGFTPVQNATFISFNLFATAIATLLQTSIGNRLPLVQGTSAVHTGTMASVGRMFGAGAMWGAVFVGAIVQMIVGLTGILGLLKKYFPISVAGAVVINIGVSLGLISITWVIGDGSSMNFYLALLTFLSVFFLQVYCRKIANGILSRGSIFFSIILVGIVISGIMGQVDWSLVQSKAWFAFPPLFPWGTPWAGNGMGWPIVGGAVLGIMSGYLGSTVESIGDYAATCAVAGEDYKVSHMNRGIFSEGLGSAIAVVFGAMPKTSYTQNIGVIATTKIASRFVVQVAAVILGLYGLIPKFGALIVAIPQPVIGAVFVIVCGSIVVSGIQLVGSAKQTTSNTTLVGTILIISFGTPVYVKNQMGEWLSTLSPFIQTVLTNEVVLAVVVGVALNIILNHIFKGKLEEDEMDAEMDEVHQ